MKNSKGTAMFFSLMPGAGHMYLGLTRQGIQLMFMFFGTLFLAHALNLEILVIFLPILWFYSIFDVRSKAMSDKPLVDSNLEILSYIGYNGNWIRGNKQGKFIGYFLIIAGVLAIVNNFVFPIIEDYIGYYIVHYIKSLVVPSIFIILGIFLLRRKKVLYLEAGEQECTGEQ
ncbi:hypothetical protein ACFIJ5_08935 [Haloimpatiens sp. FM7330]|uniref:hypothetical protein n=1 Tax=Haloimpatiens sp. FM7330 TaxID=3298610 RepID=UPI00362E7512